VTFAEHVIARRSRGFGYGEEDYDIDEFTTIEEEPKTGRCETTGY